MQRKKLAPGEYYHIYNRGVDKRTTFEKNNDYERFVNLLFACNGSNNLNLRDDTSIPRGLTFGMFEFDRGEPLVAIGAYCLMPNHFHLILKEIRDSGISKFMQKLSTAYTMYFNQKNERGGSLFQGTFKSEWVDTDTYLKYLFSYTHLNPIKLIDPKWREHGIANREAAKKHLETYIYSSYLDYSLDVKKREISEILNKSAFPAYFRSKLSFERHVNDWLDSPNPKG